MFFKHKVQKISLQITIPENLDNNVNPKRETYMDLMYMSSRKRKDLLSKLRPWGPWERVSGDGRDRKGSRKKMYSSIKSFF